MSTYPPQLPSPPGSDIPITDDHQPQGTFWGYLLEEDNALKGLLSGITVRSLNRSEEPVTVWFGNPETEERVIRWPYIKIDFESQTIAHDREHRGIVAIWYKYLQGDVLPNSSLFTDPVALMEYPIPMDLEYTVTTYARNNQHNSQLVSILNSNTRLHPRFAQMYCSGGTVRRVEVLNHVAANGRDSDQKRVFRNVYRLRIPTEIEATAAMGTRVQELVLQLVDKNTGKTDFIITTP